MVTIYTTEVCTKKNSTFCSQLTQRATFSVYRFDWLIFRCISQNCERLLLLLHVCLSVCPSARINCERRLLLLHVCLSVCPSARINSAPTRRIFIKFDIWVFFENLSRIFKFQYAFSIIHSFNSLSYNRSKASSKASSPHSAIQSFLFQMRVSSPFLKVIQ